MTPEVFTPRPYQPPAARHVLQVPHGALWMSMGLGKSICGLTAAKKLLDGLEVRRVLVVAPLRVATMVWAQEAARWQHTAHLRVQLVRGTPDERRAQIRSDADIFVINYELLPWLVRDLGGKWPFDMVIADESSRLKNPGALCYRALHHVRPKIERMVQLTGTPAANGLGDLWAQINLLDQGRRLFKTKGMFERRWMVQLDYYGRKWVARNGALEEVTERVRDIVYSIRAEDHLDLPPLVRNEVAVELPGALMDDYHRLEREMFLELEAGAINSVNAAVTSGKCLQYANGAVYLDDDTETREKHWAEIHDAKLAALESVIEEAAGEPVLVAYAFRSDLARMRKAFPQGEMLTNDPCVERRWNAGEIPLMFAHPKSAGHGLNLQGGGRILCFFGLTWSLELYEQIIERIGPTRQLQAGTPRTVFVHHIVCRGTVDELVMERLATKASVQDVLRKAMRRKDSR